MYISNNCSVLLSTYNGDKYLSEQLDSLVNQTYSKFKIVIRDDGSEDCTLQIIKNYQNSYPEKIILLNDEFGNIGVINSYNILMKNVVAQYYLFADQDDIWEHDKIEKLLNQSKKYNNDDPCLIFSNMNVFYSSKKKDTDFFKTFRINKIKIQNGLYQGTISGCLMFFNNAAKTKCLEINKNSNMLHDWDLYITALLYGHVELNDEKLINHRIHNNNVAGENLIKSTLILLKDFFKYSTNSSNYRKIVLAYYFSYLNNLSPHVDKELRIKKELFTENELNQLSYLKRKKWYLKHFNPFIYGKINGGLILLTF
jgi:glycosyltransferase involved in cell wall biosynthesis